MPDYWVYVLGSRSRVLYVGVTGAIERRVAQHKAGVASQFTRRYGVNRLLLVERCQDPLDAIRREKEIKGWRRSKKIALIEATNPGWLDLADQDPLESDPRRHPDGAKRRGIGA